MQYGDPARRTKNLPFHSDSETLARLEENSHALAILKEAAKLCYDQDMRTEEVYDALSYLRTNLKRFGAINGFRAGLDIEHPEQRKHSLEHHLATLEQSL